MNPPEYEPTLVEYLRTVKTVHHVIDQTLHHGIQFADGGYAIHAHVIRDDWDEDQKNHAAMHISKWHREED